MLRNFFPYFYFISFFFIFPSSSLLPLSLSLSLSPSLSSSHILHYSPPVSKPSDRSHRYRGQTYDSRTVNACTRSAVPTPETEKRLALLLGRRERKKSFKGRTIADRWLPDPGEILASLRCPEIERFRCSLQTGRKIVPSPATRIAKCVNNERTRITMFFFSISPSNSQARSFASLRG